MQRTVTCGELRKEFDGKEIILNGWVHKNRNHGGVHFINLRDKYGVTQVVIDEDASEDILNIANDLKYEYCVAIKGIVRKRPDSMINPDMKTGEIEVSAKEIVILNKCDTLPFMIEEESKANETLRLKYRYLDLRSDGMQKRIKLRSDVAYATREYLNSQGFMEIETPTLIKATPEGARDFLVPSRIHPGKFFALPQSPQLYKQILMVSNFDKYFQIARCYRDEDARGDRQLEFTQIDIEQSFVSANDIYKMTEGLMCHIFKKTMNIELPTQFQRLTYMDAMNTYGSDKPELRFDMKLQDFSSYVPNSDFSVFKTVLDNKGAVRAIVVPDAAPDYSRKKITELEEIAKQYGANGLAWMKVTPEGFDGGVAKFYNNQFTEICNGLSAKNNDLILLMGADWKTSVTSLGAVRKQIGIDRKLYDPSTFHFCWIVDFPLFEKNDEGNWEACHHLFSMPQDHYLDTMEENPGEVKGDLYDLVLNGYELASGSIRVHDPEIQKRIFSIVGIKEEEAMEKFGFLLESFKFGAPPHGGIAPGLDRLVMIMAGEESIREVIPFPKNAMAMSPMDDCPAEVDPEQIRELSLKIEIPVKEK
ncbi:MAG: aspartate--tRNA ligase [Spirochaetales bacterium]|nr:aspartate--tRNA ligase [Spirochaetales bacterium]